MDPDALPASLTDYFHGARVALSLGSAGGDNPLLLVNRKFCDLTGYSPEEVVGINCRFLQRDADNTAARTELHAFFRSERQTSVRIPIVNFRKDGRPFVNLLFMSKLRGVDGTDDFIFASQFDVSRSQPELLQEYDDALGDTITRLSPVLAETGTILEGSLNSIANTASMVAQAKYTLSQIDG